MKKILNTLDVSDIPEFSYIFNKIGKLVNIEADRNKVLKYPYTKNVNSLSLYHSGNFGIKASL